MTFYTLEQYEEMALERWKTHFYECAEALGVHADYQEWLWALESWHESKQVRLIDYDTTLKIKWEHRCWWADCPAPRNFLGSYSCILLDIEAGKWQEPYDHATGKKA